MSKKARIAALEAQVAQLQRENTVIKARLAALEAAAAAPQQLGPLHPVPLHPDIAPSTRPLFPNIFRPWYHYPFPKSPEDVWEWTITTTTAGTGEDLTTSAPSPAIFRVDMAKEGTPDDFCAVGVTPLSGELNGVAPLGWHRYTPGPSQLTFTPSK